MKPSMEHLIETTVPEQPQRAAVAVGRFNPPTLGHYKVIRLMKKFIIENPKLGLDQLPVVVVIDGKETGKDKTRNPLTAEERVRYMQASGNADGVRFLVAGDAYKAFEEVRRAGFEPVAIAAGSDRLDRFIELLDKHFKSVTGKNIKHVKIKGLERPVDASSKRATDRALADLKAGGELDDAEVSGSMARTAVENGFEDEFLKIVGLDGSKKQQKLGRELFKLLKARLED